MERRSWWTRREQWSPSVEVRLENEAQKATRVILDLLAPLERLDWLDPKDRKEIPAQREQTGLMVLRERQAPRVRPEQRGLPDPLGQPEAPEQRVPRALPDQLALLGPPLRLLLVQRRLERLVRRPP